MSVYFCRSSFEESKKQEDRILKGLSTTSFFSQEKKNSLISAKKIEDEIKHLNKNIGDYEK